MIRLLILALLISSTAYAGSSRDIVDPSQWFDGGDIAAIDNATELSISAWVIHDTLAEDDYISANANGVTDGYLFLRDDVASISGRTNTYMIFVAESTGTSNVRVEGASEASTNGVWTNVAFAYKEDTASTGLRLYVNGVEDANSPVSTSGIVGIDAGANVFLVANAVNSSNAAGLDGRIAHVQVWDRQITANEVVEAMRKPGSITKNLIGYYPMNGATGAGETDFSGAGNDLTDHGTSATDTDGPPVMIGGS